MLKIKNYLIVKNEIIYIAKNYYSGENPQIEVGLINGKCIHIYFENVKYLNEEFEKLIEGSEE